MPRHVEVKILPYTPQQMFDLVADVARYAEFLPWCRASRVLERKEGEFLGELVIGYKHVSESYVSRVRLTPHSAIDVTMLRGPFEHLTNQWRFTPDAGGVRIDFMLDFAFRSRILEKMMGGFFLQATEKMMQAFTDRASTLYGNT